MVPLSVRRMPAYSQITRDDLLVPGTLKPNLFAATPDAMASADPPMARLGQILGRALRYDKGSNYEFRESDLFPPGTSAGEAAGVPPGEVAITFDVAHLTGARDLKPGNHVNLGRTPAGWGGCGPSSRRPAPPRPKRPSSPSSTPASSPAATTRRAASSSTRSGPASATSSAGRSRRPTSPSCSTGSPARPPPPRRPSPPARSSPSSPTRGASASRRCRPTPRSRWACGTRAGCCWSTCRSRWASAARCSTWNRRRP